MTLDNLMINESVQDRYAEQIAIEDICESNTTDSELLKSKTINLGEINCEL